MSFYFWLNNPLFHCLSRTNIFIWNILKFISTSRSLDISLAQLSHSPTEIFNSCLISASEKQETTERDQELKWSQIADETQDEKAFILSYINIG